MRNAIKVLVVLSFFLVGLVLTAAVDTIFVPNGVTGKLDLVWSGAGAFSNSTTENLIPTYNITFNLGNTTNWWNTLYSKTIFNSNELTSSGNTFLNFNTNITGNLTVRHGTSNTRWVKIYNNPINGLIESGAGTLNLPTNCELNV